MSDQPYVSIVVVNYNGKHLLAECFDALSRLDYPRDRTEVVLVDNASSDDTVPFVAAHYPWVKILELESNRGFADGNNEGIRVARGDHIVLLNNDTSVDSGWLLPLVEALESDPRVGGAGSKILLRKDPGRLQSTGLVLFSDGNGGDRGYGEIDEGQYDRSPDVFGCCGASLILRRRMLEEVGSLDGALFMYCEDLDLAWRARLRGWTFKYVADSRVLHEHTGTSVAWSPFFVFHLERNRVLVNWKNAPLALALRVSASFAWRLLRASSAALVRWDRDTRGRASAMMRAAGSLVARMPGALRARSTIRGNSRRLDDESIRRWMVTWTRPTVADPASMKGPA